MESTDQMSGEALENLSHEDRFFVPSPEFASKANGKVDLYTQAEMDRNSFWDEQAKNLQ